jgi:FkbM family methyltransferase
VDIGAAEGYYAVGLARSKPDARIVCFEAHKPAHYLLKHLATLNGLQNRIELQGF